MPTPGPEHREVEVVLDWKSQQELRGLEGPGKSRASAQARGLVCHVPAEQLDRALRRRELAGNHVEQGCLPGSIRTEDGPPFPRLDDQGHIGHGAQATEPPADPPQMEDRRGGLGAGRCRGYTALLTGLTTRSLQGFRVPPTAAPSSWCRVG